MKTMCVVASDLSSALLCYCKTLFHWIANILP
jgi:hypothetical protein